MLWPEGSAAVVADLGSYLDPPLEGEKVLSLSVSNASAYMAMASRNILALFRLKPLAPLMIHPELFPETEIVEVVASTQGDYLAVLTADNRISVFSVQPRHDIEEVLRTSCVVTPGVGEAIGARELSLDALHSVRLEYPVKSIGCVGPLLLLYGEQEMLLTEWSAFESKDPLNPPILTLTNLELPKEDSLKQARSGMWGRGDEWITCVVSSMGGCFIVHWEGLRMLSQKRLTLEGVQCCDYNLRMNKLAVATANRIFVYANVLAGEPFELPTETSCTNPQTLQWTSAGTSLLIGYIDGWHLVSMLGLSLYCHRSRATDQSEPVGIVNAQWLVSSEALVLLATDGKVRIQNMLRWNGLAGTDRNRPVLHGNGRLMLYHDPPARGSAQNAEGTQAWLTIPLPTWYMAQNWPLAHICGSTDGRFVAVAGTIGIMLFSVATRQWKEIGDRESMVRGGLCWHGRRLVAATVSADDGKTSLEMFSPVGGSSHRKTSSQTLLGTWTSLQRPVRDPDTRRLSAHDLLTQPAGQGPSPLTGQQPHSPHIGGETVGPGPVSSNGGPGMELNSPRLLQSAHHSLGHPQSPLPTALPSTTSIAGMNVTGNEHQVVAKDVLGKGPGCQASLMAKGPHGLLGVIAGDEFARLLIYDLSANEFDLVRDMPLAVVLADIQPVPVVLAFTLIDERQVLVLAGTTLLYVSSMNDDSRKYQRQVVAEPIESFEYLHSEQQLWVFDGQEAVVTQWVPPADTDENKKFVASVPLDAYPVHFSSYRGVVSLVEAEPVRSFDGSFSTARPSTTHEVYIQYVLEAALVPAFPTAVELAKKYSRAPYFAGILESLLYRAVTNDDDDGETMLALRLIREFPEQNIDAIVAGCARKVEMKYWPRLFAAVGVQPAELFDRCLKSADLETANEYLIVVQASEQADDLDLKGPVLALYKAAIKNNQWICRQVCEFIMAVDPSGSSLKEFRTLASESEN